MTDLERARAHLLRCQTHLRNWRVFKRTMPNAHIEHFEEALLAALSWVWEEQEKVSYGIGPATRFIGAWKAEKAKMEEMRRYQHSEDAE